MSSCLHAGESSSERNEQRQCSMSIKRESTPADVPHSNIVSETLEWDICYWSLGLGFPSPEEVFPSLDPAGRGILKDKLDPGRPVGHDVHAEFFDNKIVAEDVEAAVDVGQTHGQLQEQADVLLSSALHNKAVPYQELQEEAQVDRKKGDHKDSQAGCNCPDAGFLLDPVLGEAPTADQDVNAPGGTETHDTHGKKEAKHLEGEEDFGTPGTIRHVVEAHVLFHLPVEAVDGGTPSPHEDPDGATDRKGLPGGPEVADQERVLDGQESIQTNEADGEDTPVHANEVQALHEGTEGRMGSPYVGQRHLERKGQHQQQVKDCQVDHVDGSGSIVGPPPLQEGAKASDGKQVEKEAQEEGGDVDGQLHGFHQLVHITEGAALASVQLLTHVLSYNTNNRLDDVPLAVYA